MKKNRDEPYAVIARRFRPQNFSEIVGQEHIVTVLKNSISEGRIGHAFLFEGTRGVGKTTLARIFAKALNCSRGTTTTPCCKCEICESIANGSDCDVVEVDAASNTSVDDVRILIENINYAPLRSRFKVYIVDEAHMLSRAAFNALLKTLEEPPEKVKFIFCTTEPTKMPDTILSRCQRFQFRRIDEIAIVRRLKEICRKEEIKYDEEALKLIATIATGSMRDAESLLEQIASICEDIITLQKVEEISGRLPITTICKVIKLLAEKNAPPILSFVDELNISGQDFGVFYDQLLECFRTLAIIKSCGLSKEIEEKYLFVNKKELIELSEKFELKDLMNIIDTLIMTHNRLRETSYPRFFIEFTLLKIMFGLNTPQQSISTEKRSVENIENPKMYETEKKEVRPGGAKLGESVEEYDVSQEDILTVDEIRKKWGDVLSRVKSKSITTEAFLKEATVVDLSGNELLLKVDHKFHREQLENPKYREIVEKTLFEIFNKEILIKVEGEMKKSSSETRIIYEKEHLKNHPNFQRIMELFGGRVVIED